MSEKEPQRVTSLFGQPVPGQNDEPHEGVIRHCEKLLEMAKSGALRGFAYVEFSQGIHFTTSWVGDTPRLLMVGAVDMLKDDIKRTEFEQR